MTAPRTAPAQTGRSLPARLCPALCCSIAIRPDRSFCADHWSMLTKSERITINRTLEHERNSGNTGPMLRHRWRRHRKTVAKAVIRIAVEEHQELPDLEGQALRHAVLDAMANPSPYPILEQLTRS